MRKRDRLSKTRVASRMAAETRVMVSELEGGGVREEIGKKGRDTDTLWECTEQ